MDAGLAVLLAAVDQAFHAAYAAHDLYHAGQIQLLERLQSGRTA